MVASSWRWRGQFKKGAIEICLIAIKKNLNAVLGLSQAAVPAQGQALGRDVCGLSMLRREVDRQQAGSYDVRHGAVRMVEREGTLRRYPRIRCGFAKAIASKLAPTRSGARQRMERSQV